MSKTANPHRCLEVLKADYEKEGIESFVEFYNYAIRVRVVYCTNFMIESWEYKTLPSFLREAKEKHIVATYIEETAPQKINITAKVRQAILDRQSTGKITIFDKAADSLSTRIEKEVYPQFRSEFHSTNVVKGKKDLIPAMLELPAKKPSIDVLTALVLFLTGEKAELQVHRLNNEPMLKKWLAQGTYLIEILWAAFMEDMDPDVLRCIFEVLTDSGLQQLLEKAATVGYTNDIMLSEFEEPETVLKEYVITIEPDWWSKVLKKNLESIYKNSFKDTDDINDDIIEKALACVKSVIASVCNPKEQLPARIQNLLYMQYSIIVKLHPESTASQRAMSVSKFLLDAVCGIICAPSKANFDVKLTAGSISRTNFAMLVADCLRSLFEEGDDNLSRTAEVNSLVRQVRKHIPPSLVQNFESIIKVGQVTMPPRKILLSDLNLAAIGHYFASNASFLLKNYGPEKLVCLHMFLMDNVREGSFSRTQTDSLSEDSEGGKSMMSSMGVPLSGKLSEGRTSKSTATMSKISRNISTIEGSGKRRDFSNAMSSANLGGSGVVSRFSPDTPISEVLRFVCKEQLKLQLDSSSLAKTLQDDCIFTLGHLQLLPPQELYNIRIPALIRYVLASQYCNKDFAHFAGGGGGGRAMNVPSASASMANALGLGNLRDSDDSNGTRSKSNAHKGLFEDSLSGSEGEASGGGGTSTVSSNILNLGNDERLLIRKSWMRLAELMKEKAKVETSSGQQLVSDVFYSTFWEEFLRNDESARKMFQQRSPKEREVHLNRILGHSISILDQPSLARQKIAQLGIQHCIWDIQKSSFDSMSLAFSSALFAALKGEADADTNSAWFNFLVGVSSLISDRYERVRTGYRGEIFHRHGSEWRKKGFLLTHEALMLFKSPEALAQGKKPKFTLLFAHATDFDTEETDQRIDKVTPYCFSIIFGSVIKYFCVKSSEDFKEWADNITWRIKAFRRIKEANEKEGTKYLTRAEMKKGMVKDGKAKLSKPEKAAQKVLRYRKHMDAQIKSTADFQIFDGLLQATIVIDTKGTITYLNDAASKLFELAPADMLEKNVKNFMPQQFAQQHDSYINNYITTGKRKIIGEGRDVPVKAKSGDKIVNLTVVDHQQTGQRFFIGTLVPAANDVSSSGSNEGNYKQDFSIFDKMLQPTIAITKEGLIDYVNDPMMQLTGYTKPELMGKNVTMLMTEKDANVHDSILRAYLRTGVKRIIGTPGRPVTIKEKTENTVRCLLTVTEHFQGSTPFFMGTIVKDKDLASSTESQQSEGQSDNQFALFDNLLDATICINQGGTIMYCNNATRELTGFSSAELVSKNITTLMTPMYARKHDGYLKNYQKTGIKSIIGRGREVPIVIKTGAEVKVFLTVTEHEISGVSCYIGTLTLKKDEFALYDNLLDATIVINEQGQIQYCNNAVKKLLGYNPQSLIGKNVKMLMPKEYADKHDKYLKNYMTTGKKKIIGTGRTLPFVTRNKTVVSGFLNVVESNISGKRIFVGTMTLKKAHDEAEEKQLLQATKLILCDLANPAIVISKRGMIKVFNSAAENILGYKENDVINKNIKMLMPEEFAVRHDDILKNYLKTGKSSIIGVGRFLPFIASDGETIKLYLTLSEKKDKEGKSIYFIGILTKMVETAVL